MNLTDLRTSVHRKHVAAGAWTSPRIQALFGLKDKISPKDTQEPGDKWTDCAGIHIPAFVLSAKNSE